MSAGCCGTPVVRSAKWAARGWTSPSTSAPSTRRGSPRIPSGFSSSRTPCRPGALAASANDAIVSADSAGRITYFNPGAERLFGYAATEATGQPLTILMPERFQEAHLAGLARYLATGEAHVVGKTVELAGRTKDGREFPVVLSLATLKLGADVEFT